MPASLRKRARPPSPADDWALFLDVDGCLVDFADAPDAVRLPRRLPALLQRLAQRLDGAVALVSGRPLAGLDRLFAPLRMPAAGLHGLELRNGAELRPAPETPDALGHIREEATALALASPLRSRLRAQYPVRRCPAWIWRRASSRAVASRSRCARTRMTPIATAPLSLTMLRNFSAERR